MWLSDARAPEGMRLYAIGDIHGCLDQLSRLHDDIRADLTARPVDDWRVIHIGDYADRGPDSRGVIDFLMTRLSDDRRTICLRGNHDEMFVRGVRGDRRMAQLWLTNGGVETLDSYGVALTDFLDRLRSGEAPEEVIPAGHLGFLGGLETAARFGDYYFVHAGIDPGRDLTDQDDEAQLWIREPFLAARNEFEAVIVHGHTPVERVEAHGNRIGIDTGAVYGGHLSCLVLEGAAKAQLVAGRLEPLSAPPPDWARDDSPPEDGRRSLARSLLARLPLRFGRPR